MPQVLLDPEPEPFGYEDLVHLFRILGELGQGGQTLEVNADGKILVSYNANDLLGSGAELPYLLPSDLPALERAFKDITAADPDYGPIYGLALFHCRRCKCRPWERAYSKKWSDAVRALFNACGPPR